jgi:hypothetical protein
VEVQTLNGLALPVLIFGGQAAVVMPLLIGVLAILGALTTTRLLSGLTDISTFAANAVTVLISGTTIILALARLLVFPRCSCDQVASARRRRCPARYSAR